MWTIRDSSTLRPVEDPVRRWETPATPTDRLVPMAPRVPTFPSSWVHSHSFPRLCVARPRSFSAMRASGNGHRLFRCLHTNIYMKWHPRRRNRFCHYNDEGRAFAVSYFSSGRVFGGVSAKRIWKPEPASKRSISMASLFWIAAQAAKVRVKAIRVNRGMAAILRVKKGKIVLIYFGILRSAILRSW